MPINVTTAAANMTAATREVLVFVALGSGVGQEGTAHAALPIADKGAAAPPARLTRRAPSARYAGLVVCARRALGFGDEAQLGCRLTALGVDAPPDCRWARRAIEGDQRCASKAEHGYPILFASNSSVRCLG